MLVCTVAVLSVMAAERYGFCRQDSGSEKVAEGKAGGDGHEGKKLLRAAKAIANSLFEGKAETWACGGKCGGTHIVSQERPKGGTLKLRQMEPMRPEIKWKVPYLVLDSPQAIMCELVQIISVGKPWVEVDNVPWILDIALHFGRELTSFAGGVVIRDQGYLWELEVFYTSRVVPFCSCEHNLKELCGGSLPDRLEYTLLAEGATWYGTYTEATVQITRGRSTGTTKTETSGGSVGIQVGGRLGPVEAGGSGQRSRSVSRSRSEQRSESTSTTVPHGFGVRVLGWICTWSVERQWQGLKPCEPCVDRSLETPPAVPPKAEEAPEPRKPEGDKKEEGDGRGGKKASASQAYRRQHGG
jgi:hypothetical protein